MRWSLVLDDEPVTLAADDPPADDTPPTDTPTEGTTATAGRFHALLIVEDTWSGDGRFIEQDALTWRELPLPLMGLDSTTEAHQEAIVVGHIDTIERVGHELHGYGNWATDVETAKIRQHVRDQDLRGVSADLDDVEYEIIFPTPEGGEEDLILLAAAGDRGDGDVEGEVIPMEDPMMRVKRGRLMGATIVPFPAFAECFVEDQDPTGPMVDPLALVAGAAPLHDTGLSDEPWDGAAEEVKLVAPVTTDVAELMYAWVDDADLDAGDEPAVRYPHHHVSDDGEPLDANQSACEGIIEALNDSPDLSDEDRQAVYDHVAKHLTDGGVEPAPLTPVEGDLTDEPAEDDPDALLAAAAPVEPPRAWFDDPELTGPTPLSVGDSGRVVGHIATWDTCHISFPDSCVPPPRSATGYAHYLHGEVRCSDGTRVAVGQLCLRGGHAPVDMTPSQAMAHYDDTDSCVADLAVGEDKFGIWVAGALRPNATAEAVRAAMASGVSGDWRRIGGAYELISLSSVNSPGFPVRGTRVYESAGLVASVLADLAPVEPDNAWVASAAERIAASIGRSTSQRLAALRARVHQEA